MTEKKLREGREFFFYIHLFFSILYIIEQNQAGTRGSNLEAGTEAGTTEECC